MEYLIVEEPREENYNKFIKYVCNMSNIISFKVVTRKSNEKRLGKEFNKLCKLLNISKEEVIKNYNNPIFIEDTFNKLKGRKGIIKKWTNPLKGVEKKIGKSKEEVLRIKEKHIKMDIENIIFITVGKIIFEDKMKQIQELLKEDFIKKETVLNHCKFVESYDVYYYKISNEVEKMLINQRRLYNMLFPDFPEDIRFFKDNNLWIETISHEEIGIINIDDEKEYNYLKSMGLGLKKM